MHSYFLRCLLFLSVPVGVITLEGPDEHKQLLNCNIWCILNRTGHSNTVNRTEIVVFRLAFLCKSVFGFGLGYHLKPNQKPFYIPNTTTGSPICSTSCGCQSAKSPKTRNPNPLTRSALLLVCCRLSCLMIYGLLVSVLSICLLYAKTDVCCSAIISLQTVCCIAIISLQKQMYVVLL